MKPEFPRQIFEKFSDIIFHKNPSIGSRVILCGRKEGQTDRQTDRHDEAKSRFSQFCERTQIVYFNSKYKFTNTVITIFLSPYDSSFYPFHALKREILVSWKHRADWYTGTPSSNLLKHLTVLNLIFMSLIPLDGTPIVFYLIRYKYNKKRGLASWWDLRDMGDTNFTPRYFTGS